MLEPKKPLENYEETNQEKPTGLNRMIQHGRHAINAAVGSLRTRKMISSFGVPFQGAVYREGNNISLYSNENEEMWSMYLVEGVKQCVFSNSGNLMLLVTDNAPKSIIVVDPKVGKPLKKITVEDSADFVKFVDEDFLEVYSHPNAAKLYSLTTGRAVETLRSKPKPR